MHPDAKAALRGENLGAAHPVNAPDFTNDIAAEIIAKANGVDRAIL